MSVHFKLIIPAYNSVKWLRKTLESVAKQAYGNYSVCVIDDASTEQGQREIIREFCEQYKWQFIFREKNHGALANIVEGIKYSVPKDEDVIVLLDGDDWFFDKTVLSKVAKVYQEDHVSMTYGQFITYPRWQMGLCAPLSEELIDKKNFREVPFAFSHLRTFKYKVWKMIREEDLQDASGNFFRTAWDLAIMYPLLEMTGGLSCKFMDEILYVYNMDNPLNDCIAHRELQAATAVAIRSKKPYEQIFEQKCSPYRESWIQKMRHHWISFYKKLVTPKVYLIVARKLIKVIYNRI
jgi:glycosyltransferase involved in cell wall biosynthesis